MVHTWAVRGHAGKLVQQGVELVGSIARRRSIQTGEIPKPSTAAYSSLLADG